MAMRRLTCRDLKSLPGLHERSFVLYPLSEIAPTLVIPGRGALDMLLQHCENDLEVISDES